MSKAGILHGEWGNATSGGEQKAEYVTMRGEGMNSKHNPHEGPAVQLSSWRLRSTSLFFT